MTSLNRPAGPGRPINERRDAIARQEQLDELAIDALADGASALPFDPMHEARHADRDAHTRSRVTRMPSDGRARPAAARIPAGNGAQARADGAAADAAPGGQADAIAADGCWVLVADEALARILERPGDGGDLREVEELTDPAAHADRADLRRDAHGRRAGGGTRVGSNATASAAPVDEEQRQADQFARRIAERLADAQRDGRYAALRIVAAPRLLGRLRKHLAPAVAAAVVDEIDKDLIHEDKRALTLRLFGGTAKMQ